MFAIAHGAAPGAWRRLGTRVLFAPVFMLLLVGCRTIDDDRHWGYRGGHGGHHHRHNDHDRGHRHAHPPPHYKPVAPVIIPPRAKLPEAPARQHWHRERSGDHSGRHRHNQGREHHRRGR